MLSQTTRRFLANVRQLTASKLSNENRKKLVQSYKSFKKHLLDVGIVIILLMPI